MKSFKELFNDYTNFLTRIRKFRKKLKKMKFSLIRNWKHKGLKEKYI